MKKRDFRKLKIWDKSYLLALGLYKLTKRFPKDETFALTSQIRRAGYSIPSNIAEGSVNSSKVFLNHLHIAQGSLEEVRCFLMLAKDLKYLSEDDFNYFEASCDELSKMLYVFIKNSGYLHETC